MSTLKVKLRMPNSVTKKVKLSDNQMPNSATKEPKLRMSPMKVKLRMPNSVTKKVKLSDSVHKDMLGDLPDCIILHILSFLSTKHAVRTCILSSRWKGLWKRLPALTLDYRDFQTPDIFNKFVFKVLSLRDSSISLHTLDFSNRIRCLEPRIVTLVVNYAISRNVQLLGLSAVNGVAQLPLALFSSQTLTRLSLSISSHDFGQISLNLPSLIYLQLSVHDGFPPPFLESVSLPALSTLKLENFKFSVGNNGCAEPFSTLGRLKSLFISHCIVEGAGTLCISSATLVNFNMYIESDDDMYYKIDLCTPSLCTFAFSGYPYQDISWSNISSLENVHIDAAVFASSCGPPFYLCKWLSEFPNIKSLTVTAATLQALSLIPGLLEFKTPSLVKLKFLKVKIEEIPYYFRLFLCDEKLRNIIIESPEQAARIEKAFDLGLEPSLLVPDGIVDFFLQNSPSAEVDFVDCRGKKPLKPDIFSWNLHGSEFRYLI